MAGFAYTGRYFGGFGGRRPQNLNYGDCNPQKAHPWVISSLLGVYALKSVNGFGQAAIPRKKVKKVTQGAYFAKFHHAVGAPPVIQTVPNLAV